MKVTISRQRWLRGEGFESSRLFRESDGKMCCLGMVALAEGCTVDNILEKSAPNSLNVKLPKLVSEKAFPPLPGAPKYENNWTCMAMMEINDDREISDKEREKELIKLGAGIGYELEFVD